MPIACGVTPLVGPGTSGAYLAAVADGRQQSTDLVAVAVDADGQLASDPDLDSVLPVPAAEVVAGYQLSGKAGQTAQTIARAGPAAVRVVFLGVGDRSASALRRSGAELGRLVADGKTAVAALVADAPDEQVQAFAEGIQLGSYRFSLKSANGDQAAEPGQVRLLLAGQQDRSAALGRAETVAGAVALARDLTNTPSAVKSPAWLADQAVGATAAQGVSARIWSADELAAAGFGGILAVGSGSARPPVLIELSYQPAAAQRHVALIGKGITFDSGGLSLKPNDNMKLMKTDMAGGAAVIGVMSALRSLGVTDRVTGLIAAAENMPSGSAYRPGDVITQFGGHTVEVLNTDAEGRLVLADALAYADAELAPDQVIDIATLTGSARIALGTSLAALYSTCDALADALVAAGQASGDGLWRMPLVDDYRRSLDSPVAELAHVASDGAPAGSILAALFLREFAGQRSWAHLDIAGAARAGSDDGELTKGATGFGARLLLRWLTG